MSNFLWPHFFRKSSDAREEAIASFLLKGKLYTFSYKPIILVILRVRGLKYKHRKVIIFTTYGEVKHVCWGSFPVLRPVPPDHSPMFRLKTNVIVNMFRFQIFYTVFAFQRLYSDRFIRRMRRIGSYKKIYRVHFI